MTDLQGKQEKAYKNQKHGSVKMLHNGVRKQQGGVKVLHNGEKRLERDIQGKEGKIFIKKYNI